MLGAAKVANNAHIGVLSLNQPTRHSLFTIYSNTLQQLSETKQILNKVEENLLYSKEKTIAPTCL